MMSKDKKNTEKKVEFLNSAKLKAISEKAVVCAKEQGIELKHNVELYSVAQMRNALTQLPKELANLERAKKYLKQAQEAEKKCKEHQVEQLFQAQNFQTQARARIKIAQMNIEQLQAVLSGNEPIENETEVARIRVLELQQSQVMYKAARPETANGMKVNLQSLEKKRQKAIEAGIITGTECPKFATEQDGEWVVAAKRQQLQPVLKNGLAPQTESVESIEA